ncbi:MULTISPECIES: peptidoglycan editing factor PgeF [Limibacillus]|jgi:YfiH family protein|uniref:Purine nucleoside phosphorylase n=1 Tax=Limibacillus halophilus TaxID=1579333 RepID=A0A839SYC3_9PROT|nr:peptidoglycan editing factor PgeF [Limibacillus halophilus]MBB3066670.1 hypothetical protein [Limibacillus halophilus]
MLTMGKLNDLPGVRHAFFGREGGVSEGLYDSLNCGYGSGDAADNVFENRRRAMAALDLKPENLVTAYQTHSADAIAVDAPWSRDAAPRCDAMVTKKRGIALGILTADCAPVVMVDPEAQVVGAAHAGWRGAFAGILEATLEAMTRLGARREAIAAAIGPCIAQRSYEVGPEFPEPFLTQENANIDFFCPARRSGHFLFDLKGYAARRLCKAGLRRIEVCPADTFAESDRFFSYRRACKAGEKDYGRGLSVILLEP